MNFNVKTTLKLINSISRKIRRYVVLVFIVIVLCLYGFLIRQIGELNNTEADEEAVAEQLKTVPRLRIDQDAIDKITQLQDQSVSVQSLFKEARDNPFQDSE